MKTPKNRQTLRRLAGVLLAATATSALFAAPPPIMMGINLAGAEFGETMPGTYGSTYTYPGVEQLDYYKARGIELIRLPFKWERLQNTLNGPLNAAELARIDAFLDLAEARGMRVILDMHNYARYKVAGTSYIIGSPQVPRSAYQDVWEKIAVHVEGRDCIWAYGIMNEPYNVGTYTWLESAQMAVDGIRNHDTRHAILIPGDQYSGAHWWLSYGAPLIAVTDPADNLIFEAHQYFDNDSSGKYDASYDVEGATPATGVSRLTNFVNWCNTNGVRGFVGEYGVPDDDPRWLTLLDNTLDYLAANNISGTYWAGGPWWGSYKLSAEMRPLGLEAAQMPVLIDHGDGVGTRHWPAYVWYKDAIAPSPAGTYPYLNKSATATVAANFYDTDSATGSYSQARSIRIAGAIPAGGSANGGLQINGDVNVAPHVGRNHVLSFYIKGTAGSTVRVFLRDSANTNGVKIDSGAYVSTSATTWQQVRIPLADLLAGTGVNPAALTRVSFDLYPADGADRVWQMDQFAIEEPENIAPTAAVAATGGTSFAVGASFTATATVSDASGIDFVEFLIDGERQAIDETEPYSASLTMTEAGAHRLTVIAYDNYGNPGRSTPVELTATESADYQAEDAATLSGVVVLANYANYTGTGFADYGGQNTYVEWANVHAPTAGSYALSFRYSLANSSRPCEVRVNGVSFGNTAFAPTGNWAVWVVENKTVTLQAGNNVVRLTAATASGGPNVDKMTRN